MAKAIFQKFVQNTNGAVDPSATYTVVYESSGLDAAIYEDRAGATEKTGPTYFADSNGLIEFYFDEGETIRVSVTGATGSFTQRYTEGRVFGSAASDSPRVSDLGTAALLDAGSGAGDVVINAALGSAARVDTGSEQFEIPTNAMADSLRVKKVASLFDLPPATGSGNTVYVGGYHAGSTKGGGVFVDIGAARHNGGTLINAARRDEIGTPSYYSDGGGDANCYERQLDGFVSPEHFGAVSDGVTDDTLAIQSTMFFDSIKFTSTNYKIDGTVYIPTDRNIDFNETNITGVASVVMFESGFWNGTAWTSNIDTGAEINRIDNTYIKGNGTTISTSRIAFNFKNFNWNCELSGFTFLSCETAIHTRRSFYSKISNCMARTNGSPSAAYIFDTFNNIFTASKLSANGYDLAFHVFGPNSAFKMIDCAAESGVDGIRVDGGGDVGPLSIDTCYFEHMSGDSISFVGTNHDTAEIKNNWFHNTLVAIRGGTLKNARIYGNKRSTSNANEYILAEPLSTAEISLTNTFVSANTVPTPEANSTIGTATTGSRILSIRDTGGSGQAFNKSTDYSGGIIPFVCSGDAGNADIGVIPFCTQTRVDQGDGTWDMAIDTGIVYRAYSMSVSYHFVIGDTTSTYINSGFIFGNNIHELAADKPLTIQNNAGFLRIIMTDFSSESGNTRGFVRFF